MALVEAIIVIQMNILGSEDSAERAWECATLLEKAGLCASAQVRSVDD